MIKKISSLSLTLMMLIYSIASAGKGNEGAHGGDSIAYEFTTIAQLFLEELTNSRLSITSSTTSFTKDDFEKTVKNTRVVTRSPEKMFLKSEEVAGLNFPADNLIALNKKSWMEYNLERKVDLVVHEHFGILGIERDQYFSSIEYASLKKTVVERIKNDPNMSSLQVNLFYGECQAFPPITTMDICGTDNEQIAKALTCSQQRALGQCQLQGKTNCTLVETKMTPIISTQYIGLKYCEILSIYK